MTSDSTTIYQKFSKDVLIIGIAQLLIQLRGFLALPLIAKLLGTAAFGIWAQAFTTLSMASAFAALGISFAFVRFFAAATDKQRIREGFFSILIVEFCWSLVVAIIFFLLAAPVAEKFFGGGDAINVVRLCAVILPFYTANDTFFFFFRAFREMKLFAALQLALNFGQLAILVVFVLSGWGIFGAVLSVLIAYLTVELAMLFLIVRRVGLSLPPRSAFAKIKDYLRFALPLLPSSLVGWVVQSSDRYVIAVFLGVASTGIFSAAYGLSTTVGVYLGPLTVVLMPALAHLYDNNRVEEVKKHLTYSLKYYLLLAIPSAVGLSLLAKPLLQILATPEFAEAGSVIVPFVATAMLLRGCNEIISQPITLAKKTGIISIGWGIAAVLSLGLNLLFVPHFGIIASAVATLVSFAVAIGAISYVSFRYLRFDICWGFIVKALLATAVMSGVILLLNPTGLSGLLVAIVVGAGVYFLLIYLLRGISQQEILFFRRLAVSPTPSPGQGGSNPKQSG